MNKFNENSDSITIAWGGDVNIGRRFHYYRQEDVNVGSLASLDVLRQADFSIVNLECVVATGGVLGIEKNERASYYFRARPEMLDELVEAGIGAVSTANNHSGDYGPEALMEQARWLEAAGIAHVGSGPDLESALRPAICRAGNLDIALFAIDCTQASFAAAASRPGHAYLDLSAHADWATQLAPIFAEARTKADLVLVCVHWGANGRARPSAQKIMAGHALIDAGADAVLGSSAHLLQGIEIYRERPIIHDAGDLFFDAMTRTSNDAGIFVLVADAAGIQRVEFTPVEVGFCRTNVRRGEDARAAVGRYASQCEELNTRLVVSEEGKGVVQLAPEPRPGVEQPVMERRQIEQEVPRLSPVLLPEWTVNDVPQDCRLEQPLRLGPLALCGVKLTPSHLATRGLLFVESYWCLIDETRDDWRIEFQTRPQDGRLEAWGMSSDHDPCDWMWPTSRWRKGILYRDRYSLRPGTVRHWRDALLQLRVRLRMRKIKTEWLDVPRQVSFALNHTEALSVLKAYQPTYRVIPKEKLLKTPDVVWTAQQLQQVTGGKWLCEPPAGWYVSAISHKPSFLQTDAYPRPRLFVATDSRAVARHELYTNLPDKHWDSHARLPVLQASFDGAIVARNVEGLAPTFPLLQVDDPMHALMELGIAARQRLSGKAVAVTGSAGKSSLCCMLAQAMAVDRKVGTNASENYNSRCGILHQLANMPENTDLVVMEVAVSAINSPGFQHIKLTRPDIAIITNIAPSHLPSGKTLAYVAERKGNIVEGIAKGGWLVLYRETEHFDYLYRRARSSGINVLTFGTGEDAHVRLEHYDADTGVVRARLPVQETATYRLQASGMHMVLNSLACLGVRRILGGSIQPFLHALELFIPGDGRGKVHQVTYKGLELNVIDESYNANPLSMRMALQSMPKNNGGRGRVLILGDMLELGDDEIQYHQDLAPVISSIEPDRVLLCGKRMRHLWEKLREDASSPLKGEWFADAEILAATVDRWLVSGDQILIKASNGTGLHVLAKRLTQEGRQQ